jgi:hypothetical protein
LLDSRSLPPEGGSHAAGSQHNVVVQNLVTDNRGSTQFSGGIVLIATTRPNEDGTLDASSNNLVFLNSLRGNSGRHREGRREQPELHPGQPLFDVNPRWPVWLLTALPLRF